MPHSSLKSARPLAAIAAMALLLAGCASPADHSTISQTLREVSFEPPQQQPDGTEPTRLGDGEDNTTPQAQIFIGQPARRSNGAAALAAQQARRSGDGVEVNFDGAEIREVARVILGDILRLPYTVDPRVQGQVVLSSGGPLPEQDLLPLLETVLRSFDAALLRSGGSYNIVPANELRGPAEVTPLAGGIRVSPGFGLSVVPLRFISAQTAAQLVQPLVPRADDIRVDSTRNLLLFSGTGAERQNVVETLADLDVDWLAGKSIGIFPLAYSTPEAVVPELDVLFQPPVDQSATPSPPLVRFMPVARLNAVLAISSSGEQMREIQTWISRLDRGRTVSMQYYVYPLKHAVAEDVARVLNEAFGTGGDSGVGSTASSPFASALAARPAADGAGAEAPAPAPESPVPFGGTSSLGGTPSDLSGGGGSSGSSGGSGVRIVAHRTNNSLLIRATPQIYESIEATLRRLDTPPLQVIIEATIAEVTLNDALRYGVQYFLQFGSVRFGFNNSGTSGTTTLGGLVPQPQLPGFNMIATPGNSTIAIDALSQVTTVKVLSSPSVVVQDNSAAVLTVGDEVPVITRSAVSVDDATAPVVNNVEYRDTGVILEVKPRINTNQTVSLDVAQEVSRVAPSTSTQVDPLTPTFTQRKITSRVNVTSGQTVVLGGLIQESETRGREKIPVLGDIPVVGELFGSTDLSAGRTELIVFITPRVIRNAEDARDVSEELRSRLRSLRPTASPLSTAAPPVLPPNLAPSVVPQPDPLAPAPTPLAPSGSLQPDADRTRFDLARAPLPIARPAPAIPPPTPVERPL